MTRDLTPLLAPRSIAIVGASESTDSWAPEIERSLRHVGFRGDLFPVNPKYETVWGRRCVASVGDLPRGVDLAVETGEFVALRGASGAGKSTLLHLLGGLDRPNHGDIQFRAQSLAALTDGELAKLRIGSIGHVFQAYHLLPELDALENVCLPARVARSWRATSTT